MVDACSGGVPLPHSRRGDGGFAAWLFSRSGRTAVLAVMTLSWRRCEPLLVPQLPDLLELAPGAAPQMIHANHTAIRGGEKRGDDDDVLDGAAGDLQLRGEPVVVEAGIQGRFRREMGLPDRLSAGAV